MEWDFTPRSNTLNFMDIKISLIDNKVHTTLYEKLLNLHQYITPHLAHPPGVLTGLILGNSHRIYSLCTDRKERTRLLSEFYRHLVYRGYKPSALDPLFTRARQINTDKEKNPSAPRTTRETPPDTIFLHAAFHPNNPSSTQLQAIWRDTIMTPPGKYAISHLRNNNDKAIDLRRMIVAYSRPRNLGNLLSSRNLHLSPGPPVSSFRIRNTEGLRERER